MYLLFIGIAVGLAISVPMGSVGVSVVHRVLANNKTKALFVAMGSCVADTIFGIIAIYGLSTITNFIHLHKNGLHVVGGICLAYISISVYFSKPRSLREDNHIYSLGKDFITGFILTITNPLTAITILALFAWFGINGSTISLINAFILTLGLVAGLVLWWLTLIEITGHFKKKFKFASLIIVNKIFGIILFILAFLVLAKVI